MIRFVDSAEGASLARPQWMGGSPFINPFAVLSAAASTCCTLAHFHDSEPANVFPFARPRDLMSMSSIAIGDVMSVNSALPVEPLSEMMIVIFDSGFGMTASGTVEFSRFTIMVMGAATPPRRVIGVFTV